MNGGTSREIPPNAPQIANAAINAGAQLIACGCVRLAGGVGMLSFAVESSSLFQAPSCTRGFFIFERYPVKFGVTGR
jgi:hypothetical protein